MTSRGTDRDCQPHALRPPPRHPDVDNPLERGVFDTVATTLDAYQATVGKTLADARTADATQPDALQQYPRVEAGKGYAAIDAAVNKLVDYNLKAVADAHVQAVATGRRAVVWVVCIAAATALALGAFAAWLSRGLLRQFGGEPTDAAAVAQAVTRGDLGRPIALAAGDMTSVMACRCRRCRKAWAARWPTCAATRRAWPPCRRRSPRATMT